MSRGFVTPLQSLTVNTGLSQGKGPGNGISARSTPTAKDSELFIPRSNFVPSSLFDKPVKGQYFRRTGFLADKRYDESTFVCKEEFLGLCLRS